MGGLRRRLERLEGGRTLSGLPLSAEALTVLSDGDLEALADVLEHGPGSPDGTLDVERLHAWAGECGRRALQAYENALETARKGGGTWA